jgi:putative flippase GtrA
VTWQRQFIRFAVIGAGAFAVDTALLYAALATGLGFYAGRAVSYLVAASCTWYANRRITFGPAGSSSTAQTAAEWLRFLVANLAGGVINYASYAALIAAFSIVRAYPVLGVAAGSIAGLTINFTLSKFVVFRQRQQQP